MNSVRIDIFLWSVRIFKTRSLAASECKKGRIKVNGLVAKPSRQILIGDQLEVTKPPVTFTYEVVGMLKSRVGARLVPDFIKDLTPQEEKDKLLFVNSGGFYYRDKGAGRPTKKERRLLDKLDNYIGDED